MSPEGGSTLITSAPKSDRITAAPGPATKLARSTTFSPEKKCRLPLQSFLDPCVRRVSLPPVNLGWSLFEEGGRAFLFVLGRCAEAEVGSFEQQAFRLARLQSFVHGLEGELDGDRSVGADFAQDGLSPPHEIRRRNDLVD